MKWLTYDEVDNGNHWGKSFLIDESTYDYKRYKEPLAGLRVYEDGRIYLHKNGYRSPRWRHQLWNMTDLQCFRPDQFTNSVLTTHQGERVPKSELNDIMLYDNSTKRAYRVDWGNGIWFYHPDAQPLNKATIKQARRNKQREAEATKKLMPLMDLGKTLRSLDPDEYLWVHYPRGKVRDYFLGKYAVDTSSKDGQFFCACLDAKSSTVFNNLKRLFADTIEHDYLLVKEK